MFSGQQGKFLVLVFFIIGLVSLPFFCGKPNTEESNYENKSDPLLLSSSNKFASVIEPRMASAYPVPIELSPELEPTSKHLQTTRYIVKPGDSLWEIARLYNVDIDTILSCNFLSDPRKIRPGQEIIVPNSCGIFYEIENGESLWEISRYFNVDINRILEYNNIRNPAVIQVGTRIFLPGVRRDKRADYFYWPLRGRLTSGFGMRQHPMGGGRKIHNGIDIAAPKGRAIKAAKEGVITYAGRRGRLGNTVIIQHSNGYSTIYGHCSSILVRVGQQVSARQIIARVGSTGRSTGPHLHFEIRKNNRPINPLRLLRAH